MLTDTVFGITSLHFNTAQCNFSLFSSCFNGNVGCGTFVQLFGELPSGNLVNYLPRQPFFNIFTRFHSLQMLHDTLYL